VCETECHIKMSILKNTSDNLFRFYSLCTEMKKQKDPPSAPSLLYPPISFLPLLHHPPLTPFHLLLPLLSHSVALMPHEQKFQKLLGEICHFQVSQKIDLISFFLLCWVGY